MKILIIILLILLIATINLPSFACYSGLSTIPTADTVGKDQYSLEFDYGGIIAKFNPNTYLINSEIGIGDKFEIGLDFDASADVEHRYFMNGKYILGNFNKDSGAYGIGAFNIGKGLNPITYFTAYNDFEVLRLHGGYIHIDGDNTWFVGVDKELNDKWCLMADYTAGADNNSAIGASYSINDIICVTTNAYFPNAGGESDFLIMFSYSGYYRNHQKPE